MEDRNPSPPPEFEKERDVYLPDSVGGTAISKQWVLSTLMEIINEVEKHSEHKEDVSIEVSDDLQDSACKLWDICMDKDVAVYLLDFDIVEILYGIILKSKSPRLTEISVGILGNMACSNIACEAVSKSKHLRSVILALLASPDTQTLLETVRLIKICLLNESCCDDWIFSVNDQLQNFIENSQFILNSSTNVKLLGGISEVLDIAYDYTSDALTACCTEEFISALLEATEQQCKDDPSKSLYSLCHSLHALHSIGETEEGKVVFESLKRCIIALLSSLCYQWITSHPKVDYNTTNKMSSSEVSVSCCLVVSSEIFDLESKHKKGPSRKENESAKKIAEVDDEDRQMIIKFAKFIVSAKGVISALPAVVSAAMGVIENPNEFKTPLHQIKNSPRVNTPRITLLEKNYDSKNPETSIETPIQSPEIHKHSPSNVEKTPTADTDDEFTPTARERQIITRSNESSSPATVLCDLANKLLKTANQRGWVVNGESPKKALLC